MNAGADRHQVHGREELGFDPELHEARWRLGFAGLDLGDASVDPTGKGHECIVVSRVLLAQLFDGQLGEPLEAERARLYVGRVARLAQCFGVRPAGLSAAHLDREESVGGLHIASSVEHIEVVLGVDMGDAQVVDLDLYRFGQLGIFVYGFIGVDLLPCVIGTPCRESKQRQQHQPARRLHR